LNNDVGSGVREEANPEPTASTLTDEQILQVASLITHVEDHVGKPVDTEWAIQDSKLYLLQARPITVYFPLFPEMITLPGEQKYLYIDFLVMTQGFSKPMSVLGLDIWGRILEKVQPFMPHGEDGIFWELHGREYIHLSNMLATPGGQAGIAQAFALHDGNTGKILETIDLKEYKPLAITEKNKGMVCRRLWYLFRVFQFVLHDLWQGEMQWIGMLQKRALFVERFIPTKRDRGDLPNSNKAFEEQVKMVMAE
jgi:pyruvate,water dikinase